MQVCVAKGPGQSGVEYLICWHCIDCVLTSHASLCCQRTRTVWTGAPNLLTLYRLCADKSCKFVLLEVHESVVDIPVCWHCICVCSWTVWTCVARGPGEFNGAPHLLTVCLCVQMKPVSLCCLRTRSVWWSTSSVYSVSLCADKCEFVLPKDQKSVMEHLICWQCVFVCRWSLWLCVAKGPGKCNEGPHLLTVCLCVQMTPVTLCCLRTRSVWWSTSSAPSPSTQGTDASSVTFQLVMLGQISTVWVEHTLLDWKSVELSSNTSWSKHQCTTAILQQLPSVVTS